MFNKVSEFLEEFKSESDNTLKILKNLTNESLKYKVYKEGRDIGYIAWHIIISVGEMFSKTGLIVNSPAEDSNYPESAEEIYTTYKTTIESVKKEIESKWTDEMLNNEFEAYGDKWKLWFFCEVYIKHEIHHRAQLTVLMRQAGLKVPGVCGPSKEEWTEYGMPVAR